MFTCCAHRLPASCLIEGTRWLDAIEWRFSRDRRERSWTIFVRDGTQRVARQTIQKDLGRCHWGWIEEEPFSALALWAYLKGSRRDRCSVSVRHFFFGGYAFSRKNRTPCCPRWRLQFISEIIILGIITSSPFKANWKEIQHQDHPLAHPHT